MTNRNTIRLTPEAYQWAIDRGEAITLRHSVRHGCCGGSTRVPIAEVGVPNDPTEYVEETVDGIRIYRQSSLGSSDGSVITIDLAGLWRWRRLVVTGSHITPDR